MAYLLNEQLYDAVRQLCHRFITDAVNKLPPHRQYRSHDGPIFFWAKLTGSYEISDNKYKYKFEQWRRTATGWEKVEGGIEATLDLETGVGTYALNSAEVDNAASGIQGNGVDHDSSSYPEGFSLIPADAGTPIVNMRADRIAGSDTMQYSFQFENAEDGDC